MNDECELVSLLEAARMIARRLSGGSSDTFTQEVRREADGVLKRALREGAIKSWGLPPGWPDQHERRALLPREWQNLETMIDDCGLRPAGSKRRGRVDWIEDIEVDASELGAVIATLSPQAPVTAGQLPPMARPGAQGKGRGRKLMTNWSAIDAAIEERVDREGWPEDEDAPDGWRCQADVERFAEEVLSARGANPAESTIRIHVSKTLKRLRPTKADK